MAAEKDLLLMRKHTANELKDPKKRAKFYDQEINKATLQQSLQSKELRDI